MKVTKLHKMVDFIQTGPFFPEFSRYNVGAAHIVPSDRPWLPDSRLLEFSHDSRYVIEITLSLILTELLAIYGPPPILKWVFLD